MPEALDLHPEIDNQRFTLRGVFRTEGEAKRKLEKLEEADLEARMLEAVSPKGARLVLVVARHDLPPQYRARMPHRKTADWEATAYAVRVFRLLVQASRKGGKNLRWYKRLDLETLRKTVARYRFAGRLVDVAAHILSSTILAHPFPNANHRTSLALTRVYLEFMGVDWPGYDLRGRGQHRLHKATHAFFGQSKYLLQLLRHPDLVRLAHEEGFTHLHIGPGTDAEILAADLKLTTAQVRERHEALCRRTLKEVATEYVRDQLDSPGSMTLHDWVSWLKEAK